MPSTATISNMPLKKLVRIDLRMALRAIPTIPVCVCMFVCACVCVYVFRARERVHAWVRINIIGVLL